MATDFSLADYRADNALCEVAPHLPLPLLSLAFYGRPRRRWMASQVHHIGYGGRGQREDAIWNVIHVCQPIHDLFHGMHCPKPVNQVLCAWIKWRVKGEMDWDAMSEMTRERWPGKFDSANHERLCGQWPEIERMRKELLKLEAV